MYEEIAKCDDIHTDVNEMNTHLYNASDKIKDQSK